MTTRGKDQESLEWEEIRDFVIHQMKRFGRRIDVEKVRKHIHGRDSDVDAIIDRLTRSGYLSPSDSRANTPASTGSPAPVQSNMEQFGAFRRYRERIERGLQRSKTRLRMHLTVYAGVNLFLFMIWGITGGGFPWFLIPAAGWGIGIANHLNSVVQRIRNRRDITALPELTEGETRLVKTMHAARGSFASHLTSATSISLFLSIIYTITGSGFPWHFIPIGGLGLALLIHYSSYRPKIRRMRLQVRKWIRGKKQDGVDAVTGYGEESKRFSSGEPDIVQEASAIRRAIEKQAESAKADGIDIGDDLSELLSTYLSQIQSLAHKKREMESVVEGFPVVGLQRDRANLIQRRARADSSAVQHEYDKSIAEIDQQLASLREIERSREMLDLRLRSAMNLMRQLQLDLARAKGVALSNTASFDLLRSRSEELSVYIADLEAGYSELEP